MPIVFAGMDILHYHAVLAKYPEDIYQIKYMILHLYISLKLLAEIQVSETHATTVLSPMLDHKLLSLMGFD